MLAGLLANVASEVWLTVVLADGKVELTDSAQTMLFVFILLGMIVMFFMILLIVGVMVKFFFLHKKDEIIKIHENGKKNVLLVPNIHHSKTKIFPSV